MDWGLVPGTAIITVNASNACGPADPVTMPVDIFDLIVSARSGDWNDPATWQGGVIPTINSSARIRDIDTVTTYSNDNITNIIIDGVLDTRGYYFYVYGDYTLNGEHTGWNDNRIRLNGLDATIDGTGRITHTGNVYIQTGNKTIASTADLSIAVDLTIAGNIIVTNNGYISIALDLNLGNTSTNWINAGNSTLDIGRNINSGTLVANSVGNTVNYSGAGNQNIKRSQGDTYYNLQLSGANTKTLLADVTVLGNLSISAILKRCQ